jgi:hypothetical protein
MTKASPRVQKMTIDFNEKWPWSYCTWCHTPLDDPTKGKDHVFPECIGGTLDLWVPSCSVCQGKLSRAEGALSRKSDLSLWRFMHGPGPRHKKRPKSGVVEARYILRKDAVGKYYDETVLRAGNGAAQTLPMLELDVNTFKGNTRGGSKEQYQVLADKISKIAEDMHTKGKKYDFHVILTEDTDPEIANDPDFKPRIVMDLDNRLFIRARTTDEASRFCALVLDASRQRLLDASESWHTTTVPAGAPHSVKLIWKEEEVHRVLAKIAYAVMLLACSNQKIPRVDYKSLRNFIIDGVAGECQCKRLLGPGTIKDLEKIHCAALLEGFEGRLEALVSIYGSLFRIQFSIPCPPGLSLPVVAQSVLGDKETSEFIEQHLASEYLTRLQNAVPT